MFRSKYDQLTQNIVSKKYKMIWNGINLKWNSTRSILFHIKNKFMEEKNYYKKIIAMNWSWCMRFQLIFFLYYLF